MTPRESRGGVPRGKTADGTDSVRSWIAALRSQCVVRASRRRGQGVPAAALLQQRLAMPEKKNEQVALTCRCSGATHQMRLSALPTVLPSHAHSLIHSHVHSFSHSVTYGRIRSTTTSGTRENSAQVAAFFATKTSHCQWQLSSIFPARKSMSRLSLSLSLSYTEPLRCIQQ